MIRPLAASFWCIALLVSGAHVVNGGTPKIEGQVFVATAGGESYKLGDVTVYVYSLPVLQKYISERAKVANNNLAVLNPIVDQREKDFKEARRVEKEAQDASIASLGQGTAGSETAVPDAEANTDKVRDLYEDVLNAKTYMLSGLFYFDGLSKETDIPVVASTGTDADGKFSIELPGNTAGDLVLAARAERRIGDSAEAYSWMLKVGEEDRKTKINLANATMSSGNDPRSLIHTVSAENEATAKIGKEAFEHIIRENFASLLADSQARAMAKYPELRKAGSPLNAKFVGAYNDLKARESPQLQEPDWPERLADECAKSP